MNHMIFEILGCVFLVSFLTFPLWIHGNWKLLFDREHMKYMRECRKEKPKKLHTQQLRTKTCTQYQPFRLDKKTYIICNFPCDGDCQFKTSEFYKV